MGERILLALNDQPIALSLRLNGAWTDVGGSGRSEWGAQLGLTLRMFSAL